MQRKEQGQSPGERSPAVEEQRPGLGGCSVVATGDKSGGGRRAGEREERRLSCCLWSLESVCKALSCSYWQVIFTEFCLMVKIMTTNFSWDNWSCTESARHRAGFKGALPVMWPSLQGTH